MLILLFQSYHILHILEQIEPTIDDVNDNPTKQESKSSYKKS